MHIDRFAPSPTGLLHLGHAYSALLGWRQARAVSGRFVLRLEDLDTSRVRPDYEQAILRDLHWLGVDWDGAVLRQSTRGAAYRAALSRLDQAGLTYRCTCTRREIATAIAAPQEGAPDGAVYPGLCRDRAHRADAPHAIRLNMARAIAHLGGASAATGLVFQETGPLHSGQQALNADTLINSVGDIVLSRRDGVCAYHLAVVVDDAHQAITHITRGVDLFEATPIHRLLQALLGVPTPRYHHHALIRDETGKRLAKRDDARAIAQYRTAGLSPDAVIALTGLQP